VGGGGSTSFFAFVPAKLGSAILKASASNSNRPDRGGAKLQANLVLNKVSASNMVPPRRFYLSLENCDS
jgi:hypothetical protein